MPSATVMNLSRRTAWTGACSTSKILANVPCRQYGRSAVLQRSIIARPPHDGENFRKTRGGAQYKLFESLVTVRLARVLAQMGHQTHTEYVSFGIYSQSDLDREARLFRGVVKKSFEIAHENKTSRSDNPLFWNLRNAFVRSDADGLTRELKYAFQTFILRSKFPKAITDLHRKIADMSHPWEWYPATRQMQRTIHLHVGPTNSGKTYQALKALESAKSGVYAGPLRLLAHEIYIRFQAKGKPIALVTGEEQRKPENTDQFFQSCTVEMAPLNVTMDVAVIDEIQMLADPERGWAWTQAVLGLQAKELHLCGEERVVDLVKHMCARMGDKCVVHNYQRLSPLEAMQESLHGNLSNLQKGDAVVAFSRVGLHQLKTGIEARTGRKCAIVYGALPPETRVQQAALFNDPNNDYDFLVASDAIGMGLNLEIKRVIFESGQKFDGLIMRNLNTPEVKQIGGRAGRYRTTATLHDQAAAEDEETNGDHLATQLLVSTSTFGSSPVKAQPKGSPGYVTTLDPEDLPLIQRAFKQIARPIETSGILPPPFILEQFSSFFPPNTPFSFVLSRLRELSRLSGWFHMCDFSKMIEMAEVIQDFPMSISDRCAFLSAPVCFRDYRHKEVMRAFANAVSQMQTGHLLSFAEMDWEILELGRDNHRLDQNMYLKRLESLHKAITLYLWLTHRFDGIFISQHLARHVKDMVEVKITEYLDNLHSDDGRTSQARRRAQRARTTKHQMATGKLFSSPDEKDLTGIAMTTDPAITTDPAKVDGESAVVY